MNRTASAHWNGNLVEGKGEISTQSATLNNTQYSFKTRFESGTGTNPEELLAASHAGCYTMAVSAILAQQGITANDLHTEAIVDLDGVALKINAVHLELKASPIEGVSTDKFNEVAEAAKVNCIISKALNIPITLNVTYV
ncbi:MAG: OsmC family protein [Chitinophagaceae bacterium]|jgi:osmotically inducible protein OsmC|nr:OsmC family protein [Chitinophagaceae bacterium]